MYIEQANLLDKLSDPFVETDLTRDYSIGGTSLGTASTTLPHVYVNLSNTRVMSIYTYVGDAIFGMAYPSAIPSFSYKIHYQPFESSQWFFCTTKTFSTVYAKSSANVANYRTDFQQHQISAYKARFTFSMNCTSVQSINYPVRVDYIGKTF